MSLAGITVGFVAGVVVSVLAPKVWALFQSWFVAAQDKLDD